MKLGYIHTLLLTMLVCVLFAASSVSGRAVLFSTDTRTQTLHNLDPATGSSTLVGSFGVSGYMAGLGYDPANDILYGTTTGTDKLYSIDYSTGAASFIGDLGVTLMHGLAYDSSSTKLYGTFGEMRGDGLYEIDVSNGSATLIGHIGFFHSEHANTVHGLAVHPVTGALYGAVGGPADGWGALIEINKATAQGTLIAEWSLHASALAFHPESHVLYVIDNWPGILYTIDLPTGTPTLVGSTGLDNPLGLEFVPEPATILLLGLGGLALLRRSRGVNRRER